MAPRQRSQRTLDTEKLVSKLQLTGDLNGQTQTLVNNLDGLIKSRLFHHRIPYAERKDCLQSCWLEVWKRLAKWDSQKSAISSYVYTAVDSVVADLQRTAMHRVEREQDCGVLQEVTGVRMM